MLKIDLIGNITRDAAVKEINGKQYAAFTVAVNRRGSENADFIDILRGGEISKLMSYLTKGQKVYVGGTPRVDAYIGKNDGQAHATFMVWANDLELVGGTKQNQQGVQQPQFQAPAQPQYQQPMQQQYAPQPQFQQQAPQQFAPPTPEQLALGQQRMARAQGSAPAQQMQTIGGADFMAQVNNPGTEDLPF